MEFLKKHYEKIVLCVVLLGLAGAALWLRAVKDLPVGAPINLKPRQTAPPKPMDLTDYLQFLAQVTNPPPVILSGVHNLFNPVTWKRRLNGDLFKVLKTGSDALTVANIIPLYTFINYDRPSDGGVYVISMQQHIELQQAGTAHKTIEYAKKDQKTKSGLYIIRGIKGADDNPDELNLEIPQTGETNVWISKNNPYKRVDSYIADLKYEPESKMLSKQKVDDLIMLDNEQYKIVEITNNAVRVQSSTTKVTEIKWTESPKKD